MVITIFPICLGLCFQEQCFLYTNEESKRIIRTGRRKKFCPRFLSRLSFFILLSVPIAVRPFVHQVGSRRNWVLEHTRGKLSKLQKQDGTVEPSEDRKKGIKVSFSSHFSLAFAKKSPGIGGRKRSSSRGNFFWIVVFHLFRSFSLSIGLASAFARFPFAGLSFLPTFFDPDSSCSQITFD